MKRNSTREALAGYVFASPWLLGFLIFMTYPVVASLYFSLCDYSVLKPPVFVGLDNYKMLAGDELFMTTLKNTLVFAAMALPAGMATAIILAMLLNAKVKGMALFRTCFFIPSLVPQVSLAVLWLWVLEPDHGVLNPVLKFFHINGPNWTTDPNWAKPSLVLMGMWGVGNAMLIYLAGLQDVPTHLIEAADLDGADGWQKTRHVTLPMISPVILFNLIMGIIGSLQVFTVPYIMFPNGAPAHSTYFYTEYLFDNAFRYHKMGYASAMGWIMFLMILALTAISLRMSEKHVYYEGEASSGSKAPPITGSEVVDFLKAAVRFVFFGALLVGYVFLWTHWWLPVLWIHVITAVAAVLIKLFSVLPRIFNRAFVVVALIVLSIMFLFPFAWLFLTALKPLNETMSMPIRWWPSHFLWTNFKEAAIYGHESLGYNPFPVYALNTLVLCSLIVAGTVASNAIVAYAFARLRWPGREVAFGITLATMMIPFPVLMVPTFALFRHLDWIGTYRPLWVPAWFGSAFSIFLLRQFFRTIPFELTEAAKLDGASEWRIFRTVVLPLSKAAVAVVALFAFMGAWNDFLGPLIYLLDQKTFTLSLGLQFYQSQNGGTSWNLLMAASTMVIAPVIILFFFTQRLFIQGIAITGLKG